MTAASKAIPSAPIEQPMHPTLVLAHMAEFCSDTPDLTERVEPGFDADDYAARYPKRPLPRFASIDYFASVCTLVRAACGTLERDSALTTEEVTVVDRVFFAGKSSKQCAREIINARPKTAPCPVCSERLPCTIEDEAITVPSGHLGCGPFTEAQQECMRGSVREAVA